METHLGANGVLIIKLIESQVGVVTASHVTIEMWYNFLNRVQHVDSRMAAEKPRQVNYEVFEEDGNLVRRSNSRFGFGTKTMNN